MKKTKFKSILCVCFCLLMISTCLFSCTSIEQVDNKETNVSEEIKIDEQTQPSDSEVSENAVIVSGETEQLAEDTIQDVKDGEDVATSDALNSSITEEEAIENEEHLEKDAQVEQEDIAYEGSNSGNGLSLLGSYQGLTYYNQADSRWANVLYTSTGNKTQTMASSACGPTAAAMIVSSSKGTILPTTMASLFVDNGYRTKSNGTAWAAFPFVADYFDFNEYHTTTSFNTMLTYLKKDVDKNGISDYFVIASCNSGLWTSGGHYIALMGDNGGTITVYDPYLYNGKYNTASRRAANVSVKGNAAYVSESKFLKYSNAVQYWIFSNDQTGKKPSDTSNVIKETAVNYVRYVATQRLPLNIYSGPSTSYKIVGSQAKGSKVTVTAVANGLSKIGNNKWVNSAYLSATNPNNNSNSTSTSTSKPNTTINYSTKIGRTYKLKTATTLYSKGNLTGTKYQYLAKTSCKVLSHYSNTVDYIYIAQTGRYAYVKVSAFSGTATNSSTSTVKSTVGQTKIFKGNTTLYANSNLTGTQYQYLPNTYVKVLKNVSSTVDYIQVTRTGRKAYVKVSSYK